jgi:hypothetical protein
VCGNIYIDECKDLGASNLREISNNGYCIWWRLSVGLRFQWLRAIVPVGGRRPSVMFLSHGSPFSCGYKWRTFQCESATVH